MLDYNIDPVQIFAREACAGLLASAPRISKAAPVGYLAAFLLLEIIMGLLDTTLMIFPHSKTTVGRID